VWNKLKPIYLGSFKNLVYGTLPEEVDIYSSLMLIGNRIKEINWNIKIEK